MGSCACCGRTKAEAIREQSATHATYGPKDKNIQFKLIAQCNRSKAISGV